MLERIPAGSVDHVELIRDGKGKFDMQNYALLANVIRRRESKISGQVKIENTVHEIGGYAPRLSGGISFNAKQQSLDLSGALYKEIDDEKGQGTRNRYDKDLQPIRLASYLEPEIDKVQEFAAKYRRTLGDGTLHLNGLIKKENETVNISNDVVFPEKSTSATFEQDKGRALEIDLAYERPIGLGRKLEILGLHRVADTETNERSMDMDGTADTTENSRAIETILRGVLRQKFSSATVEGGIEATWNIFDSHTTLQENGTVIDLPASSVRVSEKRVELFAASVFQISPAISLDTGVRYESSALDQSGDSEGSKNFQFLKPRALLRWKIGGNNELRFLAEREVGQLDFGDFISSTSLSDHSITAGNKELEPESLWRFGVAWEHRFHDASLILSLRHEAIKGVIDHVPLTAESEVFDSIGNVEKGTRDELEINLNLPMAQLGLRHFTLQTNTIVRRSSLRDPMTNEQRGISSDIPKEGQIQLTYDLPSSHMRFGGEYQIAEKETNYELNEIKKKIESQRLNFYVEYKPNPHWAVRAFANNLTNSAAITRRSVFTDLRGSSPIDYFDIKDLQSGRAFGISIEWIFP